MSLPPETACVAPLWRPLPLSLPWLTTARIIVSTQFPIPAHPTFRQTLEFSLKPASQVAVAEGRPGGWGPGHCFLVEACPSTLSSRAMGLEEHRPACRLSQSTVQKDFVTGVQDRTANMSTSSWIYKEPRSSVCLLEIWDFLPKFFGQNLVREEGLRIGVRDLVSIVFQFCLFGSHCPQERPGMGCGDSCEAVCF